ncbi:MAG TPA: metallophosphoesterase [Gemmatimonadaceae bacterium]
MRPRSHPGSPRPRAGADLLTRRQWIATALATGAGLGVADAFGVEPIRVTVTRHHVGPPGAPTVRVVQLTDLHLRGVGFHEQRIAQAVAEQRPDLLLLTGDSIDRRDRLPQLSEFLAMLPAGGERLAILGNWEHWGNVDLRALRGTYERHGIRLLRNESVALRFAAGPLLVTGLDDLVGGRPDVRGALAQAPPSPNHLLLAHCPAHREAFVATAHASSSPAGVMLDPSLLRPRLMLSGHTHGGQLRFAGWAPFLPQGSGRYVSGWYRGDGPDLYVSRGLGTSVVPARVGAPPEIAVFDWAVAAS